MKRLLIISLIAFGCENLITTEEVVIAELPAEQNLVVVEGSVTNQPESQRIVLSRSNSFSGEVNPFIEDASVLVETMSGGAFSYTYSQNGVYLSDSVYRGISDESYRVRIVLPNGDVLRSSWSTMLNVTEIVLLSVDEFSENDPDNPGQIINIFFPRITARDSADVANFYRWKFLKDGVLQTEPESITLQNDRFFDGNFIPNLFDEFEYLQGEEMTVELHSINEETYLFLELLKAQLTTLGASASSTPGLVRGNITNLSNTEELVLGYFGTTAISRKSAIAEN